VKAFLRLFLIFYIGYVNLWANQRVIALSPAINEIVYALESGDKIVANTIYCNYPNDAIDKPKVGGYFSPNLEKIVALHPDIVLMQSNKKFANNLHKLGIKTASFKLQTINDIKESIKSIGKIVNQTQKAQNIIDEIDTKLNNLKNIIKNKKILIVIGHNTSLDKKVFVVGQGLYFDDIIKISGNTNAFGDKSISQPVLNLEGIISTKADIVVLLTPYMKKKNLSQRALLKPWERLPINATKYHTIYIQSNEYAGIPSHRLSLFLDDFRGYLEDAKIRYDK
jgi:iron complex transport system substrate-binding protein